VLVQPNDGVLPLLELIGNAERSVWIKQFTFTHPDLLKGVIAAHIHTPLTPPNQVAPDITVPTSEALTIALAKAPADRTRLEQVAANLIDNAIKYTPGGGTVAVDVRQADGTAVLTVRDTGIGIPADELPRIWDRLFRGDTSRTECARLGAMEEIHANVYSHAPIGRTP